MAKAKRKLELIGTSEEHKAFAGKDFSPHHLVTLQPKTTPQEQFIQSYYEQIPMIFQVGSAGTGKTALALYCALSEVLDKGTVYDKIIIIRSAVQARDIGFLKGTEEEKNEVYEAPYKALCDELLAFKSNNYDNLKAKHLLEFHNTSFLRGMTFDNAIIIADEFQSMTYHELATICTRVGINSRILFCGDFKQSDLHKRGDKSGFHQLMAVIDRMPSEMVDTVRYMPQDIIRSGIVKEFLIAEESLD